MLSKFTAAHIAITGVVLAILIGVGFWFLGPYKTLDNIKQLDARSADADQKLSKETANKKDLAKAKQEVAETQAQFAKYDATKMPQPPIDLMKPTDETAMTKAMIRLWRQPYELCTMANRFAHDQAKRSHVTLLSPPFTLPGQTTDPAGIPTGVIPFAIGPIQVVGTFQHVNDYARAWNQFRRVVAVDGFALTPGPNTSGAQTVIGAGTVTIYVFPHASPTAPGFGGGTGQSGGPAGFNGGPGVPPGFGGGPGKPAGA
jgi:hypothetical protein